jgi:hypothetical protein
MRSAQNKQYAKRILKAGSALSVLASMKFCSSSILGKKENKCLKKNLGDISVFQKYCHMAAF